MTRDRAGRKSMSLAFTITDLRERPEFFDTVARRIWQAWWEAEGASLDSISGRLRENMSEAPIPFALVAHDGGAFLGTASVIASDLAERPKLTPWVAAVWVEEKARGHGVGAALDPPGTTGRAQRPRRIFRNASASAREFNSPP